MKSTHHGGSIAALGLILSAVALGDSFSSIVVYGDSLSDNGNIFAAAGFPGPPYYKGRFSNGPVAVEQMAAALNSSLSDYAWGGATTGVGNLADGGTPTSLGNSSFPGMLTELNNSQSSIGSHLGSLFIVWGGFGDFTSPSPLDKTPQQILARGVGDVLSIVATLESYGVKNIVVPGLPDEGLFPFFTSGQGPFTPAEATAIANQWNAELIAQLPNGVKYIDTVSLFRSIVSDPSFYGFTNVTDPCFDGTSACANPSKYLFWDSFHPTTQADAFIAQQFIQATVPEPSEIALLGSGLVLMALIRRRKHVVH